MALELYRDNCALHEKLNAFAATVQGIAALRSIVQVCGWGWGWCWCWGCGWVGRLGVGLGVRVGLGAGVRNGV